MREKILSLAKGNFIYETPKLCLSIEKLVFEVTAGTHGTASFLLENSFGTRVKGLALSRRCALISCLFLMDKE